jgi:hypothetical protein
MIKKRTKKKPATDSTALSTDDNEIPDDSVVFSQKELRELSFEISARCFSNEPAPRLTLSAVHPWRIHAYWHITPTMMKQALEETKAPHALVIRFFDMTPGQIGESSEEATFDIEVDGLDNNWYIDVWQPGKRYIAELGVRGGDNKLHVFVRSNEIQAPRAEPSPALEFNLARYKGAKPISETQYWGVSTYSVAQLTSLLPAFKSFPDVRSDAESQTLNKPLKEPEFPDAPLSRVQAWGVEPTIENGNPVARERYCYGSDFPTTPVEKNIVSSSHVTTCDAPIDYKTVPELPEIDPRTVSECNMEFTEARRAGFLAPEESSVENAESHADKKQNEAETFNKAFPEVHAEVGHLDAIDCDIHRSGNFKHANVLPRHKVEETNNECIEDVDSSISAPAGPAPKPVVALEEAIAESLFSATNHDAGLSLSVQLELSGKSSTDQVLTLFGESVDVDEQGHFSIRIKLDKGPQLVALLRAHRKDVLEGY